MPLLPPPPRNCRHPDSAAQVRHRRVDCRNSWGYSVTTPRLRHAPICAGFLTSPHPPRLEEYKFVFRNNHSFIMSRLTFLSALASLGLLAGEAKALTVSPFTNVNDLAQALLVPGWAPVPGSVVATQAGPNAIGFFDNAADIGITDGVLLTTGTIFNALGPNNSESSTGPGALSSFGFDFVAVSPGISWRYVFGSEEYQEYVGSEFNDFFRLTLNGENLALIPGTSTNVAINSVNQTSNTAFYRPNVGAALNTFDTQYDGLTTLLTASKGDLIVGNTYSVVITHKPPQA